MNKICIGILTCLVIVVAVSCNSNKNKAQSAEPVEQAMADDSTRLYIDVNAIDTAWVLFTDDESQKMINVPDVELLSKLLLTAKYDTLLNRGDIMMTMVAQDYTLILSHKDKSADGNEWIPLWKADGRTKYRNKWFSIPAAESAEVYRLFDNYRK